MNMNQYNELKRPNLWAKSPASLWEDEHISHGMLSAHLNPASDAASRKTEFIDCSAKWIAGLVCGGRKRLLDLGCGPGLYAVRFHEMGLHVQGVDISDRSIAYAKEHSSPDIVYTCADYTEAAFPEAMNLITMIYCDFGVLPPEARRNILRKTYQALQPGGAFVFDVFTSYQYADFQESSMVTEFSGPGFWSPEPHRVAERRLEYREDHTFLHMVGVSARSAFTLYYIWEHVFSRDEIRKELHEAGFSGVEFYGDIAGTHWYDKTRTLCAVARK